MTEALVQLQPLYGPPSAEGTRYLYAYRLSSPVVVLLSLLHVRAEVFFG